MLDSGEVVVVKKICNNQRGNFGALAYKEFNGDMEMVSSKMKHNNVVKLLCCISSNGWKLLVYEFLANNNLFDFLSGNENGSSRELLQWFVRPKIAISVARIVRHVFKIALGIANLNSVTPINLTTKTPINIINIRP